MMKVFGAVPLIASRCSFLSTFTPPPCGMEPYISVRSKVEPTLSIWRTAHPIYSAPPVSGGCRLDNSSCPLDRCC
jgi:hypothetical protein